MSMAAAMSHKLVRSVGCRCRRAAGRSGPDSRFRRRPRLPECRQWRMRRPADRRPWPQGSRCPAAVDARADEGITAVFQSIQLRLRQHFFNPDDVAAFLIQLGERDLDLFGDFRVSGYRRTAPPECPGNQVQCLEQVWQASGGDTARTAGWALNGRCGNARTPSNPDRLVPGSEVGMVMPLYTATTLFGSRFGKQSEYPCACHRKRRSRSACSYILLSPELDCSCRRAAHASTGGTAPESAVITNGVPCSTWPCSPPSRHTSVRVDDVGVHIIGDLQINAEGLQCGVGISQLRRRVIADLQAALSIGSIGYSIGTASVRLPSNARTVTSMRSASTLDSSSAYTGPTIDMRRVFAG